MQTVRIETRLLRDWSENIIPMPRPEQLVSLEQARIPEGKADGYIDGVVLLDLSGKEVSGFKDVTNVYIWWSFYLAALQELYAGSGSTKVSDPEADRYFHMQRKGEWITCSWDPPHDAVIRKGTALFDELLRKSLDEAERFYRRIIELDPENAALNTTRLNRIVLAARERMGVAPWQDDG